MSDADEVPARTVYLDTRRLAWFGAVVITVVMGAALVVLGEASVPILTAGVTILGMLVGAYAGIDRIWGKSE